LETLLYEPNVMKNIHEGNNFGENYVNL